MKRKIMGVVLMVVMVAIISSLCSMPAISADPNGNDAGVDKERVDKFGVSITPAQEKIDYTIRDIVPVVSSEIPSGIHGSQSAMTKAEDLSNPFMKINEYGEVHINLRIEEYSTQLVDQLKSMGMRITVELPKYNIIEGWLPCDMVESVSQIQQIKRITTPSYPVPRQQGAVDTAGNAILNADSARSQFGIDGSGVRVGVISDGVNHIATSQASGDLPGDVHVIKDGDGGDEDEGTAMLEIIHDLAPGCELSFYAPESEADMIDGIQDLEADGCDIIVDDLGFHGAPKFEDGPLAQEVKQYCQNGGVYVSACGNYADDEHYQHNYNPRYQDGEYYHDFGGGDITNTLWVCKDSVIVVTLQWNNEWGNSGDDFDLYILDHVSGAELASSDEVQDGTGDPYERVAWLNPSSSLPKQVDIVIEEYSLSSSPTSSIVLDLYLFVNSGCSDDFEYATVEDSVSGHSALEEILSTAAADASSPNTITDYSSRGKATVYFPDFEQREVPNITGIAGVQTKIGQAGYFGNPFDGTSAAAPHIAAIAALIWGANPYLSSTEVKEAITSTAHDIAPAGWDAASGFGRADALLAIESIPPDIDSVSVGGIPISYGDVLYRDKSANNDIGAVGYDVDLFSVEVWVDGSLDYQELNFGGPPSRAIQYAWNTEALTKGYHQVEIRAEDDEFNVTTYPFTVFLYDDPFLLITPSSVEFTALDGGSNPDDQVINIVNGAGDQNIFWTASTNRSWLGISSSSGNTPSTPSVQIDMSDPGLSSPGTYYGTVTINSPSASNNPQTVNVTMTVVASSSGDIHESVADTFISWNGMGINHGDEEYMYVGGEPAGGELLYRQLSLIKFNVASLSGLVDSATLRLNCDHQYGSSMVIKAYRLTDPDWAEMTVTYDDEPFVGINVTLNTAVSEGWESWGVTDIVQYWIDHPATNLGFILVPYTWESGEYFRFVTKEHPDVSLRPELEVKMCDGTPNLTVSAPRPDDGATTPPFYVGQTIDWYVTVHNLGPGCDPEVNGNFYIGNSPSDFSNDINPAAEETYQRLFSPGATDTDNESYQFTAGDLGTKYFNVRLDDGTSNSYGPFQVLQPPSLNVTPANLSFEADAGGNPLYQTLNITEGTGGTLDWTASNTQPWLDVLPAGDTSPSSPRVYVDATGLPAGTYNDTITITASNPYTSGNPKNIPVTLIVVARTLTMAKAGSGTVTPNVGTHDYIRGSTVNLLAVPETNWYFNNWSGDLVDIENFADPSTTITMNENYSITANFINRRQLTTTSTVGGSVVTPGEGSYLYAPGTPAEIVAEASPNFDFARWIGSGSPAVTNPSSPNTTIIMDDNYSITAKFTHEGDYDEDGRIDLFDFVEFAKAYDSSMGDPEYNPIMDFNDDGNVDLTDFISFSDFYGLHY